MPEWDDLPPVEAYADVVVPLRRGEGQPATPTPTPKVVLRPIADIVREQREPQWLIHKVIERGVLAVLAGPRGTFKSFIALDWAMRIAIDGHPVVILSGEGAGLDRRVAAWVTQHAENTDLGALPLVALERPINLNAVGDMLALQAAIATLAAEPQLIVIDTFSKFSPGLDENDNAEVALYLASLAQNLRDQYRATVLIVAHTGHSESGRPRGASSLMSNPDAEYIVARAAPLAMVVTVTRERFKDTPALAPLGYEAKVVDLGRFDSYGEAVTSLALVGTDAPPMSDKKYLGKNQQVIRTAIKEWVRAHPGAILTVIDMKELCKAHNVSPARRQEVIQAFVALRILTPAAGSGWVVLAENL